MSETSKVIRIIYESLWMFLPYFKTHRSSPIYFREMLNGSLSTRKIAQENKRVFGDLRYGYSKETCYNDFQMQR